uniref:Uncharacterized protein n=1 Tax=Trichogramma kaykai TaxID=54128 RepID=A0ABD2WND7_9HYME
MKKKTFENVSRSFKLSITFSSAQGPIAQMKNSILKSRRASSDSPVDSYNRSATSPLHDEANGCRNQDRHAISSCGDDEYIASHHIEREFVNQTIRIESDDPHILASVK